MLQPRRIAVLQGDGDGHEAGVVSPRWETLLLKAKSRRGEIPGTMLQIGCLVRATSASISILSQMISAQTQHLRTGHMGDKSGTKKVRCKLLEKWLLPQDELDLALDLQDSAPSYLL
jgi:hypothetical protein